MSEIALLSATAALTEIHAGTLSARQVVDAALAQIDRLDPVLHGYISVRHDEVRREAAALDERQARGERLPLHGLPLAVKDVIPTAGIRTTYGVPEFKDNIPVEDAGYVAKLRQAGALIVGKTSTPEFAAYMNTRNTLVGTTLSPWNTKRSSGGSSGGTAVAIATGMAALGIGTDFGGSVRFPAGLNGIVGLRGSPGFIPAYPSLWAFDTFAVPGPMCRTVADTDLMLKVMATPDPHSAISPMAPYTGPEALDVRKLRLAWSEDLNGLFPVDQEVRVVLRRARKTLDGVGIGIADAAPPLEGVRESIVPLRSLRTLILHATRLDATEKLTNRLLADSIERAKRTPILDVAKAEIARSKVWANAVGFFDKFDILALPASQMVGFDAEVAAPRFVDGVELPEALDTCLNTYAITMLGWPGLVVPCGFAPSGEPVGIQLVAPHGKEARLMAFGLFLENELRWTNHLPPMAHLGGATSKSNSS